MVVIYGYRKNLCLGDLSEDAVAYSFRILNAVIDLGYGAGRGALIMDLANLENERRVDCKIMDTDRFRRFITGMKVASAKELSGRSVVGFVDGEDLQGMVANEL